ncbi:hypothetical protein CDL12_09531 [Handroanthus impetiginosus]|uniref:Phytocyanin domain-containing protein n=1 Tax=Handroanthus impetiginosus TaxID=429701 RepID=A0A2G9HJW9_9LAMI|nr:hypothetical protein CDL12_09531 [Handroanthus impetiginosus]
MASQSLISKTRFLFVLTTVFCFLQLLQCAYCSEFEVGERTGWVVPQANDTEMHNEWASTKRFKVGDTVHYKECNSTHPNFFSNTGNTVITLDRSGFFYFISGAAGHCDKGQRMIVWVIAQDGSGGHASTSHASNNVIFSYGLFVIIVALQFAHLH